MYMHLIVLVIIIQDLLLVLLHFVHIIIILVRVFIIQVLDSITHVMHVLSLHHVLMYLLIYVCYDIRLVLSEFHSNVILICLSIYICLYMIKYQSIPHTILDVFCVLV